MAKTLAQKQINCSLLCLECIKLRHWLCQLVEYLKVPVMDQEGVKQEEVSQQVEVLPSQLKALLLLSQHPL